MTAEYIIKSDNVAAILDRVLEAGEGLLRLRPTWVPRSILDGDCDTSVLTPMTIFLKLVLIKTNTTDDPFWDHPFFKKHDVHPKTNRSE